MADLRDKLIRIERSINVYDKDNNLVKEVDVNITDLNKLKSIVNPKDDDPELYDGYKLDEKQIKELNNYLLEIIEPRFELYSYYLVCGGIYDWDKK